MNKIHKTHQTAKKLSFYITNMGQMTNVKGVAQLCSSLLQNATLMF